MIPDATEAHHAPKDVPVTPHDSPLEVSQRPSIDIDRAAEIAREIFGAEGVMRELQSQQDRNFAIQTPSGTRVLKVANRGWGRPTIDAQNSALLHVASRDAGFQAPVPVPALDGQLVHEIADGDDVLPVRLLTFVEGRTLTDARHLSSEVVADLGRLAGRSAAALADFDHPGLDRVVQWDLRQAEQVIDSLLASIAEPDSRARVSDVSAAATARLAELSTSLRVQAIHGDVTDDNVVGEVDDIGRIRPNGIIDFGDLSRGYLVGDLAATCASILHHQQHEPLAVMPAILAFHEVAALTDDDVAALWPLVMLRGAVLVASNEHQIRLDPDNDSIRRWLKHEWRIFHSARSLPFDLAEEAIRASLGWSRSPRHTAARDVVLTSHRIFPDLPDLAIVDLSVTGPGMDSGRFLESGVERELLVTAAATTGAATRYAEPRLTRTVLDSTDAPATVALGIDLALPAGTDLRAPWDGVVVVDGSSLMLDHETLLRLIVRGVHATISTGTHVVAGQSLGAVTEGDVHVQVCVDRELEIPAFSTAALAPGWTALCPDPSPMFGADLAMPADDVAGLLLRRDDVLAPVQEHYYAAPMRIERGWRHHLIDTAGRSYVDMVNNVAAVGHGHPQLADAVDRQMRMLNTNSRFHYTAITEFSERLAALAPDGLDTVFLVNSGSEAVDLALRIAQATTGRLDLVAVHESYHGWTMLSDAVTTSLYDNPRALESRPDWVHLASSPNPYRGRFRGADAGASYALELRELVERIASEGRPPAAFICEPVFGNAGGVLLPEGYLAAAYEAVRSVGGLCIADEVQVGYGRLGHHWWAFQMHGVLPDIITIAKSIGNGHPLGAVITTRAIADAFATQGSFFSSAGGSPVSCVTGIAVLDIIESEGLQANAALVGDRLIARATELMARYPIIGAVHGMGLYLGIELVRDHSTLEPATGECAAICDRLRELGIIVQPTGERANVLKMKPPMCLTMESADFFIDTLEEVLRDGW